MPKVINPTVRYNITRVNKEAKEAYLFLIFQYDSGKRLKYSTREKVEMKYWDSSKQRAIFNKKHPEYVELNLFLNELEKHTLSVHKLNPTISTQDFRLELDYRLGRKERPETKSLIPTFLEFIQIFIDQQKTKEGAKRGTWKKFETVLNHLKNYAKEKEVLLNYENIDWKFRDSFVNWLYSAPRNHSINNAAKIIKVTKQFMNEALKHKYHENHIYKEDGFSVSRVKVKNKVRLNFEELKKLIELDLTENPRFERVRDLFVVGSFTGLRFSDWYKIKKEDIRNEDGAQLLRLMTQKTESEVIIPFLPELKTILEKYDYALPKISVQEFNRTLKDVCKMILEGNTILRIYSEGGKKKSENVEKWERVSSHCARRSFATNFYELGISPVILMQVTGHTTEKQFFEYIDLNKMDLALKFAKEVALKRNI